MKNTSVIVLIVMLTFCTAIFVPPTPTHAASLTDLLPQVTSGDNGSSGKGLINALLVLLLGKYMGNSHDISSGSGSTSITPSTSSSKIISTAQKYMGVPYVWGGGTPAGFDCSGFTQYVMKQNGISIPRTAAEQFATGSSVAKSDLKTGDLVFFTTYKPGASHVGFYMGDGKFIHASSAAKQVTISSLDEEYYTEKYIGARRYK
jgi:cell wall-associated NlpC family hydrolase